MNTLHAVPAPAQVFTEGRPMPLTPTCSNCGSHVFTRIQRTEERERYTLTFGTGTYPVEDWDSLDRDIIDSEPWECWNCDVRCDDDLSDLIDESR